MFRTPDSTPEHRIGAFGRPVKRTAQSLHVPNVRQEFTSSSSSATTSSATDDSEEEPRSEVFTNDR